MSKTARVGAIAVYTAVLAAANNRPNPVSAAPSARASGSVLKQAVPMPKTRMPIPTRSRQIHPMRMVTAFGGTPAP